MRGSLFISFFQLSLMTTHTPLHAVQNHLCGTWPHHKTVSEAGESHQESADHGPLESKTCISGVPVLPRVHWNSRHIPMSLWKGHGPSCLVAENIYGLPRLSNSLSKFCWWWAVICMSHPMSLSSREQLAVPEDHWEARKFITLLPGFGFFVAKDYWGSFQTINAILIF